MRSRSSGVAAIGNRTVTVPEAPLIWVSNPACENTSSIGASAASTSAQKALYPGMVRGGGQAFEQACADTVSLKRVGDRERRLGLGASGDPDVVADRDDLRPASSPFNTDVGAGVGPVGIQVSCQERRVDVCHPVEAQVPTAVGELVEEPAKRRGVCQSRRTQTQRPAVAQDHVKWGCSDNDGHHRRAIRGVVEALHHQQIIAHVPRVPSAISLTKSAGSHATVGEPAPALP